MPSLRSPQYLVSMKAFYVEIPGIRSRISGADRPFNRKVQEASALTKLP